VIHHFPLFSAAHSLSRLDFRNFYLPFSKVIKEKFLTAANVFFLEDVEQMEGLLCPGSNLSILKGFFKTTAQTHLPVGHDRYFFLPFFIDDQHIVVALITGLDPLFVKKVGHDWLKDTRDAVEQEFLTLKQAGVDLQTGLLNVVHLNTLFDTCPEGEHIGLALVEIYPKVRTAMEDMQHVRRSAAILKSFTGEQIPLYHIGQSVFAYPCRNCDENSAAKFGPLLVSFLKREQFKRVHIGYSQGKISNTVDQVSEHIQPGTSGRQILDEAWLALQSACKRGPFSFCTYHSLQNAQRHPLYASNKNILARVKPHWQQLDQFSLVQIHSTNPLDNFHDKIVLDFAGCKKIKASDTDVYLLLPTTDSQKTLSLVQDILQSFTHHKHNKGFISAGIARFPFSNFKKTETLSNCRKALLHGELLGPGKITLFDALSLNVSGDIFYGEGDIPRAIREYKKGLLIAAHDVNLLNSLGVSYAMLNRHHGAIDCFLKALTIKRDDFISCYNLGLERKLQGNIGGAVQSFEHALQCQGEDGQDTENARKELPLQLGKLYCLTGRYQESLDILLPWYSSELSNPGAGRAFRYIGESFHGIGRDREAMGWLQRAIRFDEFDADALSLLGDLYLANNEGDEIALKLCEKSVELNQTAPLFYLRLATAQIQCGHLETAKENLQPCLRNKTLKEAAGFQMGLLYLKQGQRKRARYWFSKTLDHAQAGTTRHTLAGQYLSEIETKQISST
jgi:tetratricopeptide (TPR) repeat protein